VLAVLAVISLLFTGRIPTVPVTGDQEPEAELEPAT